MATQKQLTLPSEQVKKTNQLVRSRQRLSPLAAKIFTTAIVQIKKEDHPNKIYSFHVSSLFPVDDKISGKHYQNVTDCIRCIMSNYVEIPRPDLTRNGAEPAIERFSLFSKCLYVPETGTIEARFDQDLKPHLIALATHFTQYPLLEYMLLSSSYSQRLYEILNSYAKSFHAKEISLDELHFMLDTPDSLQKRFPDFRRRVLEPAHKEINEKTNLEYEWVSVKKGRSVVAIEFIFSKKAKEEAQKKQIEKERKATNKYVQQAVTCFKERGGKDFLVNGKCPKVKPKTKKCIVCKKMDYFAV